LISVDVVIPAYNAKLFIENALQSVVSQTYPPHQIIVIDDGSKDGTPDIVRSFSIQNPKIPIKCIEQPNAGPSAARNRGLRNVEADFVALLDADDEWLPTKLEKQLALYQGVGGRGLGLVYCDYGLIDSNGKPIPNFGFTLNKKIRGDVFKQLRKSNQIAGSASAVLIPTHVLQRVGLFDEALVSAEDWDLWLRIAEYYSIDFVDEPLVLLRQHSQNSQKDEGRMLGGELLFANKLFMQKHLPLKNIMRLAIRIQSARRKGVILAEHNYHPLFHAVFSNILLQVIYLVFIIVRATRRWGKELFHA